MITCEYSGGTSGGPALAISVSLIIIPSLYVFIMRLIICFHIQNFFHVEVNLEFIVGVIPILLPTSEYN
jgi:hypothetical protein